MRINGVNPGAGLCVAALALLCCFSANAAGPTGAPANYGTLNGVVAGSKGEPLKGAVITFLREGLREKLRQLRSSDDGSFMARLQPGRYIISAAADGYDGYSFSGVDVRSAEQLYYRFNLVVSGAGNTLPEKRADRDSAKWRLRSAQVRRSILQVDEGKSAPLQVEAGEEATIAAESEAVVGERMGSDTARQARPRGMVESYFAASADGNYAALNFALAQRFGPRFELVLSGQASTRASGPERFESSARWRINGRHALRVTGALANTALAPQRDVRDGNSSLSQVSVRAIDEWEVRDGIIVVVGLDYSRFVGLSSAGAITPRIGFQYDLNARTRLRAGFARADANSSQQSGAQFEDGSVSFTRPQAGAVAVVDGRALVRKSRRLEFGVERVLDNWSSIEATAFADTDAAVAVGLVSLPILQLDQSSNTADEVLPDSGRNARGIRVVYSRRMSKVFGTSVGYSFGRGQSLNSELDFGAPGSLFKTGYFQSGVAQVTADINSGTRVSAVFRFSPAATVFAIDPFAGRVAVYDPSLSIQVTQVLPRFGLPVHAEAVLDARNLLDVQNGSETDTRLFWLRHRRLVQGGILLRF